jgi:phosphohistidine phosphatase
VADGYGERLDIRFDPQIYAASSQSLFDLVRHIPERVHAPLLVGHNPGLQQLVLGLVREDDGLHARIEEKFPTSAVALIELPSVRWDEVAEHSGTIRELILPRDLD